jgi:hypothetical protein
VGSCLRLQSDDLGSRGYFKGIRKEGGHQSGCLGETFVLGPPRATFALYGEPFQGSLTVQLVVFQLAQ